MKSIDFQMDLLAKAMSLRLQRHGAIAGNIANADTPGYRPQQVAFEDELQKAAKTKSLDRLSHVEPKLEIIDDHAPALDGNSVSLDKQMAALSENAIVYNASAEFLSHKIKLLKTVIG